MLTTPEQHAAAYGRTSCAPPSLEPIGTNITIIDICQLLPCRCDVGANGHLNGEVEPIRGSVIDLRLAQQVALGFFFVMLNRTRCAMDWLFRGPVKMGWGHRMGMLVSGTVAFPFSHPSISRCHLVLIHCVPSSFHCRGWLKH